MTEYYRHNIINEEGMHRFVTAPISMAETLTLRDQFAMAALTGMLANPNTRMLVQHKVFETAYEFADAMLEARKEKK